MPSSVNCSFWSNSDVTDNSTVQLTDLMLTLCWHRLPREYKLTASCLQVTHNRTLAFKHLNWTADGHTCYKPRNVNSCHVYHVNNHWTPTALSTNNTLWDISLHIVLNKLATMQRLCEHHKLLSWVGHWVLLELWARAWLKDVARKGKLSLGI
jgi:hypothetical protein